MQMKPNARKRRGNSRYYLFFVLLLIALGGLGAGVYYLLLNVPWFNLKQVRVEGNSYVPDSLVAKAATPYLGQNLLSIRGEAVTGEVMKLARVKSAKVQRRFLNTLRIKIEERKSIIYVRTLDGELFPVSEEGMVLEQYGRIYNENLPIASLLVESSKLKPGSIISNSSLNRILSMHRQLCKDTPEFVHNISEYYTVDDLIYIVDARNGVRLIPGRDDLAKQISRYQFVQDNGNVAPNAVLDLRFENQVVVKAGG